MRPLTFDETRILLSRIVKYKKENLMLLIEELKKNSVVFRIQKSRIFNAFLGLTRQSESFREGQIGSLGTCIARLTHSNRLLLMIPCMKMLISYPSSSSLGVNRSGEIVFLRGLHLSQTSIIWANENIARGEGVSVLGPTGIHLGFGEMICTITSQKTIKYKKIVLANHADIGSYTRIY